MRRRIRGERRFCEFNMSTFNFIFADQVFIDPTFSGIFVCGPLQSFAVNVCARTIACEQALLGNLGERSEPHEGARACRSRVCFSRYPLDWISPKSQNGELDCRLLVPRVDHGPKPHWPCGIMRSKDQAIVIRQYHAYKCNFNTSNSDHHSRPQSRLALLTVGD